MSSKALRTLFAAWVSLAGLACGDDDTPKGPSDASMDAAVDAGGNFIPRRDASVVPTDPIRECSRLDPNGCPSGQTCDVIVRQFDATTAELTIYTGCVDITRERGDGDPCDPEFWNSSAPFQMEGLTDLVYRDQCGPGLVCAPDKDIRGGSSCQPICSTGRFQEQRVCDDVNSYCVALDELTEWCIKSDGCDVAKQTGCKPGLACYLRPRSDFEGFISVCYPPPEKPLADGRPCESYNACRPGSSCNGPIKKSLASWMNSDLLCRPSCNADGTLNGTDEELDGGADDGGTSSGATCNAPKSCAPFAGAGVSLSGITTPPYGQCE